MAEHLRVAEEASQPDITPTKKLPFVVIALGFVSLFTDIASDMMIRMLPVFLTTTLGLAAIHRAGERPGLFIALRKS